MDLSDKHKALAIECGQRWRPAEFRFTGGELAIYTSKIQAEVEQLKIDRKEQGEDFQKLSADYHALCKELQSLKEQKPVGEIIEDRSVLRPVRENGEYVFRDQVPVRAILNKKLPVGTKLYAQSIPAKE